MKTIKCGNKLLKVLIPNSEVTTHNSSFVLISYLIGEEMEIGVVRVRNWLLHHVKEDEGRIVWIQSQLFGISSGGSTPPTGPLYWLMCLGAAMGNELFYIVCFPLLGWLGDSTLQRRLLLVWVGTYFVGQLMKDLLKLPRPRSPPVVALEKHYEAEYGFPSTHSMVGVVVPFFTLQQRRAQWAPFVPEYVLWSLAGTYCLLMTTSRIYLGVHSLVDVYSGLLLGMSFLWLCVDWVEAVEEFVLFRSSYLLLIIISCWLIWVYFFLTFPNKWVNSPGDTTLIIGAGCGTMLAFSHFHEVLSPHHFSFQLLAPLSVQFVQLYSPHLLPLLYLLRIVTSLLILFLTRAIAKTLLNAFLPLLLPPSNVPLKHRYEVELPCKFVTYTLVGWNAICMPLYLTAVESYLFVSSQD